jgi:hypothetical protein
MLEMRGFDCSPVFGLFDKGLLNSTVGANDMVWDAWF